MEANSDCKADDYEVLTVSFTIERGTIVRASETDGEWCRCRVEGVAPWGVLVREIPSGGDESKGTQFAAIWERVELIPLGPLEQ
jgi:hypothetical protein